MDSVNELAERSIRDAYATGYDAGLQAGRKQVLAKPPLSLRAGSLALGFLAGLGTGLVLGFSLDFSFKIKTFAVW